MAFCEITKNDALNLLKVVKVKLNQDISQLKDFKKFTKDILSFLIEKGASQEKAITMIKEIPSAISAYRAASDDYRKKFRIAKVSMDAIDEAEESYFQNYDKLATFLEIGDGNPIQLTSPKQMAILADIDAFTNKMKVEFEGKKRKINGISFENRVTDIAKAGFKYAPDTDEEAEESAALVHGNTVDAIAKLIFDSQMPEYSNFKEKIDQKSFDTLVGQLIKIHDQLNQEGWLFRSGITVYNEASSLAGEIDLLGVHKDGTIKVFDFKSLSFRPTTAYFEKKERLGVEGEVEGLSKQQQYATQGYLYSRMLSEMFNVPVSAETTILAIPIVYDNTTVGIIKNVNEVVIKPLVKKNIREEYLDKPISEIVAIAKKLNEAQFKDVPEAIVPVKPTRQRKNVNTNYKPLERIARANEKAASSEELKRQVDDVNRMFGDDTFIRLLDIVDAGLFGQFKLDGITIFKNASTGTPYHEGWHRFTQLFLTKGEKTDLYTDIRKKGVDFTTRDGRNLNTKDANFLDIEEFLAEEFAKYALDRKGYKFPKSSKPKTIFQKIWDFLSHFFSGNSAIDYFEDLYEGRTKKYVPSASNAFWGTLNSSIGGFDNNIISNERFPLYKDAFDALLGQELSKYKKTFTAFKQSKALQKRTIDNIIHIFNERYLAEDNTDPKSENYLTDEQFSEFENILTNQRDFVNAVLQATEYDTLKDFQIEEEVFTSSLDELTGIEAMKEDYNIYDDMDEDNEDDASKPTNDRFDRGGNEESAHSYADDAIKDFFRSIPIIKEVKKDGTVVYFKSELGYIQNHKAYDIFYKTKKMLEGAYGLDQMVAALTNPNNHRKFPELAIIAQRFLEILDNKAETNKFRVLQNEVFIQTFTHAMELPHVNNMQLFVNYRGLNKKNTIKNTSTSYKKLFRSIALKIIKNWSKNFKDRRFKKSLVITDNFKPFAENTLENTIFIDTSGKVFLNPFVDYNLLFPGNSPAVLKQFFNLVGIQLNDKVYTDADAMKVLSDLKNDFVAQISLYKGDADANLAAILDEYAKVNRMDKNDLDALLQSLSPEIMEYVLTQTFVSDPVEFFKEKRKLIEGETKALKYQFEDVSEFEEMYGDLVSSGSFSVEGKTKYPFYRPNQMLQITGMLNSISSDADFRNNPYLNSISPVTQPWMKRSFFMQNMFDINENGIIRRKDSLGRPIEIVVEDISSFKELDGTTVTEKTSASLGPVDKLYFDILTFMNSGAIEIPRAETSPTTFSMRLSQYKGSNYPFSPAKAGNFANPDFQKIIRDQFLGELEKRLWYKNNNPSFKTNKKKLSEVFNVFEGILSKELKDKIMEVVDADLKFSKGENVDDVFTQPFDDKKTIRQQFEDETVKYFDDRSQEVLEVFRKLTQKQKDVIRDSFLSGNYSDLKAVRAFVGNRFILASEFSNLIFGDLYNYKNPYKRGKFATNNGTPMHIDNMRNMRMNNIQFQTLTSVARGETKPQFRDFRFLKSGTIADVEMTSSYVGVKDEDNQMLKDLIDFYESVGELTDNNRESFIADLKDSITSKYQKINIADGQGLVSLDFYRNFAIAVGIWDAETHEKEYERQVAIFRRDNNLYFGENKVALTGDALANARENDDTLISQGPFSYFNPLKLSYTGPDAKAGPLSPVFDKFSLRPIIPETVKGTRDEVMLKKMAEEGIDYLKFESGTKGYVHPTFQWIEKLSDGSYNLDNFDFEFEQPQTLYSAFLKHQLNTDGVKKETIFSSQFRKIVFDVLYTPAVQKSKEAKQFFEEKYEKYLGLVKEAISIEEKDLFNTLGIEVRNDGTYYVSDFKNFVNLLRQEGIKRKLPVNNINYLQYDESTKKFLYPLDFAFNRTQITDLLSGMMDDRLRRLKLNGTQAIQVSSAGFERQSTIFKKPTAEQLRKYGTNGLHYYHLERNENGIITHTSTMGIKTGLTSNFKPLLNLLHPDGKKIKVESKEESLNRLNEALRDETWRKKHQKKLTMVGYRIPVQNNNFIDRMEVMEFLPESVGAIIIPPIELIIKSGSDFDIDKMNILLKSFDKDTGKINQRPDISIDEINRRIAEKTFDAREYKRAQSEWKDLKNSTDIDIKGLINLQRKVKNTIQFLLSEELANSTKFIDSFGETRENPTEEMEGALDDNAIKEAIAKMPSLDKTIVDFYTLDKEIDALKEKYHLAESNIDNEFQKLIRQKEKLKGAISNEIINVLSDVISSPFYYPLLISPSTASIIDSMANEMVAATRNVPAPKDDEVLYDTARTAEENIRYTTNLGIHDDFLSKRKDLGGYAIHRTWSSIFNKIKFSIAEVYNVKDKTMRIPTPLIPIADRSKVVKDGRVLMHGESVTGVPIRNMFDQLQSATIDIANSPAYPYTGINRYNKQVFTYLLHQKVDPKIATWFINQPILKRVYALYETKAPLVKGYTLKHALVEIGTRTNIFYGIYDRFGGPKYHLGKVYGKKEVVDPDTDEVKKDIDMTVANPYLSRPGDDVVDIINEQDVFTFDILDNAIRTNEANSTDLQKKVLAYFMFSQERANDVSQIQFAYNTDTTKYSTLPTIIRNENTKRKVKENNLFERSQIDSIEKDSMIAPFDYTDKAKKILQTIYPILYKAETVDSFSRLLLNVTGRNIILEKSAKIIENDFIEFVYKNFGEYEGRNMFNRFQPLAINLDNTADHKFMSTSLLELKAKYPELLEIPFVDKLDEDSYFPSIEVEEGFVYNGEILDNLEQRNILLNRSVDNPTFEKDIFTSNWTNLINFDPEKLGLKKEYTFEQQGEISKFFRDLVYFSLYQSGLSNTGNGFSDLIPYQHWSVFIQNAFTKFDTFIKQNDANLMSLLDSFENLVIKMNPKINWRNTEEATGKIDAETGKPKTQPMRLYRNYYRGKQYKINDSEMGYTAYLDEEDQADVKNKEPEVKEEVKLETGRYVKYNDEIYIVTKQNKNGTWQIYNPSKTGRDVKKSVSERNLELRPEKARVVGYNQGNYIVTPNNTIISLASNKIISWAENDPNRKGVLESKQAPFKDEPNTNDNMDFACDAPF